MRFRHDKAAAVQTPQPGTAPSGFVIERPPPGLARGRFAASPLWIGALGMALLLGTLLYYFLRSRKPRS